MASYPTSVYSATTKNPGDTIQSASINNLDAEIAAIEAALTGGSGLAHDLKFVDALYDIGKSGATRPRDGFFSRNVTIGGTLSITGAITATAGQIAFPATQSASSNANTLDDYEEGTWTPTDGSGAALSLTLGVCQYVKIAQLVIATADVTYPSTVNGAQATIAGLPFTNQATNACGAMVNYSNYAADFRGLVTSADTTILFYKITGAALLNSDLSTLIVRFTAIYRASA